MTCCTFKWCVCTCTGIQVHTCHVHTVVQVYTLLEHVYVFIHLYLYTVDTSNCLSVTTCTPVKPSRASLQKKFTPPTPTFCNKNSFLSALTCAQSYHQRTWRWCVAGSRSWRWLAWSRQCTSVPTATPASIDSIATWRFDVATLALGGEPAPIPFPTPRPCFRRCSWHGSRCVVRRWPWPLETRLVLGPKGWGWWGARVAGWRGIWWGI